MNVKFSHDSNVIPVLSKNHRVTKYHTYDWVDNCGNIHIAYEPVYERICELQKVYLYKEQRVFLINDNLKAYTSEGKVIRIPNTNDLKVLSSCEQNTFYVLLENNGYKIVKGELVQTRYYFPLYTLDYGFIVCECRYDDANYRRFSEWNEVFELKQECINWCNCLNKAMHRNYPEITE